MTISLGSILLVIIIIIDMRINISTTVSVSTSYGHGHNAVVGVRICPLDIDLNIFYDNESVIYHILNLLFEIRNTAKRRPLNINICR